VQWIYLTALVWYESVFAIVLPIYLTEMLFPERRDEPWLGQRGLVVAAAIFLLSSVGVWWLWSTIGVKHYGSSTYHVPFLYVGIALVVIAAIIAAAWIFLKQPKQVNQRSNRRTWSPWLVGLMAFGHVLAWFILIALAYVPAVTFPGLLPRVPIAIGVAWVVLGLIVVRALSNTQGWQDRHRLALIFGASLASMIGGILVILSAAPIDQIGKAVFDLIAIVLFVILARRLRKPRYTPTLPK
jgi:MFS family permease